MDKPGEKCDARDLAQLSGLCQETMNFLGMQQHTDRFIRLLLQANITSLNDIEKLDEYECEQLRLPYDMVSSVQKRLKSWRVELDDRVELTIENGEQHWVKKEEQARGRGGTGQSHLGTPRTATPTRARSPSTSSNFNNVAANSTPGSRSARPLSAREIVRSGMDMDKDMSSLAGRDVNRGADAYSSLDLGRISSDMSTLNSRLQKMEYVVSQGMKGIEDSSNGTKTVQSDLHRMSDTIRMVQQETHKMLETQQQMADQVQQQQQMQQQLQSQQTQMQQQLQQMMQTTTNQHNDLMAAIQQSAPPSGAAAIGQRRVEEQLARVMTKLEHLENHQAKPAHGHVQDQLRDAFLARFERIEAMTASQSTQQKHFESNMSKCLEDWLERASTRFDRSVPHKQPSSNSSMNGNGRSGMDMTKPDLMTKEEDNRQHWLGGMTSNAKTNDKQNSYDHEGVSRSVAFERSEARSALGALDNMKMHWESNSPPSMRQQSWGEVATGLPQRPPSAPAKSRSFQRGVRPGGANDYGGFTQFPSVMQGA